MYRTGQGMIERKRANGQLQRATEVYSVVQQKVYQTLLMASSRTGAQLISYQMCSRSPNDLVMSSTCVWVLKSLSVVRMYP